MTTAQRGRVHDEFTDFAAVMAPRLLRSAVLLCGDRHLAEDLVQTTLAKLFVAWSKVRRADSPEAYAHGTLTKTFLSHRRLRRSSERPTDAGEHQTARDPDHAGATDARVDLLTALAALEPTDRAVLVLRYWEDRSVAETAHALGMTEVNVRTRAARAAKRLRTALTESKEERS